VLHQAVTEEALAATLGVPVERVSETLLQARGKLYASRAERVWPGRDDKVLVSWNGFMQRAFAEAGRIFGREDYLQAATRNAAFILDNMLAGGRLRRSWRDGAAKLEAYLEDYASLANALMETYEATHELNYFVQAHRLADDMLARFWDATANSFFDTAFDHEELIGRPRELTDNVTPSGTSLAVEA